jgi:hypothetical protein
MFSVINSAAVPEITVLGNSVSISDGDTTPRAADHTDFGTVVQSGPPISRTFFVFNDGDTDLTLGTVTAPTGFTVVEQPESIVPPGLGTGFLVALDTDTVGAKIGDVSFSTSDSDENPFNFRITGVVTSGTSAITGFTLINADTDQAIRTIGDMETIDLASLPTMNLNIRADTNGGPIESVRFGFDGNNNYRVENLVPYALFSDQRSNYHAGTLGLGGHTLSATPFSGDNATGDAGTQLTISFIVVDSGGSSSSLFGAVDAVFEELSVVAAGV